MVQVLEIMCPQQLKLVFLKFEHKYSFHLFMGMLINSLSCRMFAVLTYSYWMKPRGK